MVARSSPVSQPKDTANHDTEFQRHYADYKAFTHALRLVLAASALSLLAMAFWLL